MTGQYLLGRWWLVASLLSTSVAISASSPLPATALLTQEGDLSAQMIAGIHRFFDREIERSVSQRGQAWAPDHSGEPAAYERSVAANRRRFAEMIGLIDERVAPVTLVYVASSATPARVADTDAFSVFTVRWSVLPGLEAEGLLLQPKRPVVARLVVLPDADQTPETIAGLARGLSPDLQYARRLAESGCQVLVPVLVDRTDRFSGHAGNKTFTNQPHREWILRQSFVLGRHIIGYEVQKVLAAIDWFTQENRTGSPAPIGVVGWGEGGLLAFYSTAVDTRISSALVSGYFGPRERIWEEPLYRNLFGVLREFGDARLAQLVVPRALHLEHARLPKVDGPPAERPGRAGAAPGRLGSIEGRAWREEIQRAQALAGPFAKSVRAHAGPGDSAIGPVAETTLADFLRSLRPELTLARRRQDPTDVRAAFDETGRQERTVRDIERYNQRQLQLAERARDEFLWSKVKPTSVEAWTAALQPYRERANEMIGRYRTDVTPMNPRSRFLREGATWTAHEVMLDVLPDIYAWGYLLVPKGLRPDERRPVVVAQHGVTGLPESVVTEDQASRGYAAYKAYAVRLAERGFITFAPHNPYRGDHPSRMLQRKAQPIGKTIFSVILAQHEVLLRWLGTHPNVDPARIAFYGLSYGGQSAMRLPILLDGYALSICSGDFNEWTWKNASVDFSKSYMYNNAYERPEFQMGLRFGYAEMAALFVPRPFMVERGHNDGVGIDEWVAYEYAKVNRLYNKLGLADRTAIEYFDGPHTIHGQGTFQFLHRHLQWPEPAAATR